jgi:hypothetical protein
MSDVKMRKWEGWITLHRIEPNGGRSEPLTGSRVYHFEAPENAYDLAEEELRRAWELDGRRCAVSEKWDPNDTETRLTSYPSIKQLDE